MESGKHIRKTCFATWSTRLPKFDTAIFSNDCMLDYSYWYFRLRSHVIAEAGRPEELYSLRFVKNSKNDMPKNLVLTVYASSQDKDLLMFHKRITEFEAEIWSMSRDAFTSEFPEVDVDSELKFQFFVPEDRNSQITRREISDDGLSLDLGKLMDEASDADVQLQCEDCTIPAHKLILGARSEVFRAMLHTDMLEGRRGAVEIEDMEPGTLRLFVRYLYTGSLPELSEDLAVALFAAADKYRVSSLKTRCSRFLAGNLARDKACEMLLLADAHGDEDLKGSVMAFILDEQIPKDDGLWSEFCSSHPMLAIEVYRKDYKDRHS